MIVVGILLGFLIVVLLLLVSVRYKYIDILDKFTTQIQDLKYEISELRRKITNLNGNLDFKKK